MLRQRTFLLFALIGVLFISGQLLFTPKEYVQSALRNALLSPRIIFDALRSKQAIIRSLKDLSIENQGLRGQLSELAASPERVRTLRTQYLKASVFSTYPLTSVGRLIINAGETDGVRLGQSVEAAPGIFIGVVAEVRERESVVQTIFGGTLPMASTTWQMPVKIGKEKTDALLVSGVSPKLTIISRKKGAVSGDSVSLAAQELPLGLSIGSVGRIIDDPSSVFLEATVSVPYSIGGIGDVFVRLE